MERIKYINQAVVLGDELLCEVIEARTKSGLYLPDSVKGSNKGISHMIVVAVGSKVDDVREGQIVIYVPDNIQLQVFPYKNKEYTLIKRYNCKLIVDSDNFAEKGSELLN
jgi:co-chaperonin GroES (HSP10)